MTWDPEGIVVGEAFRDYVEELRETHTPYEHASGGGNAHLSANMSETESDEAVSAAQHTELDSEMTRRAFAIGVGAMVGTAATAGTVTADGDSGLVPNFDSDLTPEPRIIDQEIVVDEHDSDMAELEYIDNDGDVQSMTSEFGIVLEHDDDEDATNNPVGFYASNIETEEFTQFPRGVTRGSDDDEEDVSALDAEEWSGDLEATDDGDALVLSGGDGESATFSLADLDAEIDSGEARKVLQLVMDVDELEADATVTFEVVDAAGDSVSAVIDPEADEADEETIATAQGSGIVFQGEIGELGGADLDTLEEIVVEVEGANADLTLHGMNLELDSKWSFGTRETYDEEDEEVQRETLREPEGLTWITSLDTLTDEFSDATIEEVHYYVETHASEAATSNFEVMTEEIDRGSYSDRYHLVGGLEVPGGLYEVDVVESGELVDKVRHPSDVHRAVEFATDLNEIPEIDDVDDIEWTDATSTFEGGDHDDLEEVTITSTLSAGDVVGVHYDLQEDDDIVSEMAASPGGGGAALGGGGFMSSPIGWITAAVTGVVGTLAIFAARARSGASSAVGR